MESYYKEKLIEWIEYIQEKNHKLFIGTNESQLHTRQEIAESVFKSIDLNLTFFKYHSDKLLEGYDRSQFSKSELERKKLDNLKTMIVMDIIEELLIHVKTQSSD